MGKFNLSGGTSTGIAGADTAFLDMLGSGEIPKKDIQQLDIRYLIPYDGQPFKPYAEDRLQELAEDIKINGVLSPVIVRKHPEQPGMYQILAGHNRIAACKLLDHNKVPAIIKDVDDTRAQLIMVNTNLNQRHELLPSEKAFAYKQQIEAYEKLGAYSVRTTSLISEQSGDSKRSIQYYIRLTYLITPLLEMVDRSELVIKAGAALSYLSNEDQTFVYDFITDFNIKLSNKQAEQIKGLPEVNEQALDSLLMSKSKKTKTTTHIKIPYKKLSSYFNNLENEAAILEIIGKALQNYFAQEQTNEDQYNENHIN